VKVLDKEVSIELHPATVMQVDKYARTGIFTDDRFLPFTANALHTNIVFQLKDTEATQPLNVRDVQLPLYNKQEVDIISANEFIIGYVDVKNEEYYYITNNFCKVMGLTIPVFFTWIIGITAAVTAMIIIKNNYAPLFATMLLVVTWLMHISIKFILNRKIENEIDECLKTFSAV